MAKTNWRHVGSGVFRVVSLGVRAGGGPVPAGTGRAARATGRAHATHRRDACLVHGAMRGPGPPDPRADPTGTRRRSGVLTVPSFQGMEWLWPLGPPAIGGMVALLARHVAARCVLGGLD